MGIYFRKRLGLGPLALNFAKSGVGLSVRVRGFRMGVTAHGRKYLSAGLPGTGVVYRHYARKQKPLPVYRAPELTHPVMHPHSLGYFTGYICGLIFWIGIPIFLVGWIVSLVWRAAH